VKPIPGYKLWEISYAKPIDLTLISRSFSMSGIHQGFELPLADLTNDAQRASRIRSRVVRFRSFVLAAAIGIPLGACTGDVGLPIGPVDNSCHNGSGVTVDHPEGSGCS
jgi:hypothetical protein